MSTKRRTSIASLRARNRLAKRAGLAKDSRPRTRALAERRETGEGQQVAQVTATVLKAWVLEFITLPAKKEVPRMLRALEPEHQRLNSEKA